MRFRSDLVDERVVAAVSGGPDSMAMLAMLVKAGKKPHVVHINYHKRAAAEDEEQLVRTWCQAHDLPLAVFDAPHFEKGNFQARARDFRYHCFEKIAREQHIHQIALAHQQDDALETWQLARQRNSIPRHYGLPAVTVRKDFELVRPLLDFTKTELETWCKDNQIPYGIDESNLGNDYTRNRLRHHWLETLSPDERAEALQQMREDEARLQERRSQAEAALEKRDFSGPDAWFALGLQVEKGTGLFPGRRELDEQLGKLKKGQLVRFEKGNQVYELQLVDGRLYQGFLPEPFQATFQSPEELAAFVATQDCVRWQMGTEGERIAYFSLEPEDFPVTIETPAPGDAIELRFGRKKVSRFFIDRKIPAFLKERWLLVKDRQGNVVFVPGLGCAINTFHRSLGFFMLKYQLDSFES